MRKVKVLVVIVVLITTTINNIQAQESMDYKLAKSYFRELDSLCAIDYGKLWDVKLYGPTMFVDPETRIILANQADKDKLLLEKEGLYTGKLPENINVANTSFNWGGVNWTMLMWSSVNQQDKYLRDKLFIHESWHRVQEEIGINPTTSGNAHLDELQGTILVKLEFMALGHALADTIKANTLKYLNNALIIRKYRQLLFPGNNENAYERHEGMAEYTGYKLCGYDRNSGNREISKQLELSLGKDGFTNSFAYVTGPVYGFLYDGLCPGWIKQVLRGEDIPTIGSALFPGENIPADTVKLKLRVSEITIEYQAESLLKAEYEKSEKQKILVSEYIKKILEGDQLIIPNVKVNFGYNPQEKVIKVDDKGVIYKTMRLTGDWGILEVRDGIFRSNDWQVFIVSAPNTLNSDIFNERDYNLTLNPGWKMVKIKEGKYTLKKE